MQTTILIAGSRNLPETAANLQRLEAALDEMHCILATQHENWIYPNHILHGGAKGADQLAKQLATKLGARETEIHPDYKSHHPKLAPLKRNDEMIKMADAVIVIYAPNQAQKGGSAYVAQQTIAAGKHLLEVLPDGTTHHTAPNRLF